ncbi:MAG: hypothetical protein M3041_00745 [Acidobacteriota bacterium]|nr:hypothetical protein [Acidobacteriota bacterium]
MSIVAVLAAAKPAAPLQIFNREHQVIVTVTTALSGSDLQFTASFPRPVKSYLKQEYDNLALEFHVDSDNNKATGNEDSPDVRRGAEYIVTAVARVPRAGVKAEEVTVTQNSDNTLKKTSAKIRVDASRMIVTVPLSELKLKKGQKVRIAVVAVADGELADATVSL